jgi:hypothetical protein
MIRLEGLRSTAIDFGCVQIATGGQSVCEEFWTSDDSRSAEPRRTGTHEAGRCRSARGTYEFRLAWNEFCRPPEAKFKPFRLPAIY